MKKRLAIGLLLIIIIFFMFVLIRENSKRYIPKDNMIKNYVHHIDNFIFFV